MRIIDNIPLIAVNTALLINIIFGIKNDIGFSELMIRCIIVTITSGIFSFLIKIIIKKAIKNSRINRKITKKNKEKAEKAKELSEKSTKPILDIKVPPLDDKELFNSGNDDDSEFIEVNPANMSGLSQIKQD